jgi:hypothetical protein
MKRVVISMTDEQFKAYQERINYYKGAWPTALKEKSLFTGWKVIALYNVFKDVDLFKLGS